MRAPDERRKACPRHERWAICERAEAWARRVTRKWGPCSTSGVLTLAADLIEQEPGFQDFVIAHELLHLRVPNHGRLFKALMTAYVPDWKTYEGMLRTWHNVGRISEA